MPKKGDSSPKRSSKKTSATAGKGWGAVAKRKEATESVSSTDMLWDFKVGDGESVIVQFLDDEPYCYDAHSVKNNKGRWVTLACQLATQGHCLMCEDGNKQTWKAAFKVLDYRGKWDKEKKENTFGDPIEKIWKCSNTLALQIQALVKKKGIPLTEQVLEVTRTGGGPKDTSYNFQRAFDEEAEKVMKPIAYESEVASIEELCQPLPDLVLEKMGIGEMAE